MAETPPWIAVVDDDPAVLRALSRLLRTRSFRVKTYESGQEFLAALPEGPPQCLIVDFQMPEMNGLEPSTASYKQWYSYSDDPHHRTWRCYDRLTTGRKYVCSKTPKAVA